MATTGTTIINIIITTINTIIVTTTTIITTVIFAIIISLSSQQQLGLPENSCARHWSERLTHSINTVSLSVPSVLMWHVLALFPFVDGETEARGDHVVDVKLLSLGSFLFPKSIHSVSI